MAVIMISNRKESISRMVERSREDRLHRGEATVVKMTDKKFKAGSKKKQQHSE